MHKFEDTWQEGAPFELILGHGISSKLRTSSILVHLFLTNIVSS